MAMFLGEVEVRWLGPRDMVLLRPFSYLDSSGTEWKVKPGMVVNGASIPRCLWAVLGSPFVGKYRRASVVHDAHCVLKERASRDVHAVFYEACKTEGCDYRLAYVMYQFVRLFGPRW